MKNALLFNKKSTTYNSVDLDEIAGKIPEEAASWINGEVHMHDACAFQRFIKDL